MRVDEDTSLFIDEQPGLRFAVLLPALLLFLFLTFPGGYLPLRPGLEASWQYALNYLPNSGLEYGADVTFPYGPLGFLLHPMDVGYNLAIAAGFRLVIHLLFGIAIAYAGLKVGLFPALLFMVTYLFAILFGLQYESHLVIVGALWAAIAVRHANAGNILLPPLAALTGISLFIKPTLALCLLTMLALAELARLLRGYTHFYSVLLRSFVPFAVVSAALWLHFFGAAEPFRAWVLMTLEYMRYNAVAMALEGPQSELYAGLLCVAAFIGASILWMGMRSEVSVAAIILFPTLFTLFKQGFERQDAHVLFFFAPYIGILGVLVLICRRFNELALACLLFLGATLLVIPIASARNAFYYGGAIDLVSGKQGLANVKAMANLSETRLRLTEQSQKNIASLDLPEAWTLLIQENHGTMDVLPFEITFCPANGIPWLPNPTVHSYVAYTAFLDARLARHFSTASGPDFLLLIWQDVDERFLPYDVPATWRTLIKHYRLVDVEPERALLLLVRRAIPVDFSPLPSTDETLSADEWVEVPSTEGMLLAAPHFQLTREGLFMKTALRIPPIFIEFELADGETQRRRILPESAANGIVVNRPSLELSDAIRAFSELSPRSVTRFRITGPGTRYYAQTMPMTLTQVNVIVRSENQLARVEGWF